MGDINGKSGLSVHQEEGAKACGKILGTVVSMDQNFNTVLPLGLALGRQ